MGSEFRICHLRRSPNRKRQWRFAISSLSIALRFRRYCSQSRYRPKMAQSQIILDCLHKRGPIREGIKRGGVRISSCQVTGHRAIGANHRHSIANRGLMSIQVCHVSAQKFVGALRKGPPFHGSRSSREIKIQNASCQMGGCEVPR